MSQQQSIYELLTPVLSGEARSFAEVCRTRGLRPSEVLNKLVDEDLAAKRCTNGSSEHQPPAEQLSPFERYQRLREAAHAALDAELTGARFRAVRTMNDLADRERSDGELTPGTMRAREMVRRACISLMRLHTPTCNMGPPQKPPPAPNGRTTNAAPLNRSRGACSSEGASPMSSSAPAAERLIPPLRLMDDESRSRTPCASVPMAEHAGTRSAASPSPAATRLPDGETGGGPAPSTATKPLIAPPRAERRRVVRGLLEEGIHRATVARALREMRRLGMSPSRQGGSPTLSRPP